MAMTRSSHEGRLVALEQARDTMLDRLFNRMVERERVLLGERFQEYNDALANGLQPPAESKSVVDADPQIRRINVAYWQLEVWKRHVETTIPSARRRRTT